MTASCGRILAGRHQLFGCTKRLLELTSITFVNIEIKSFAHGFKDSVSNLHFDFSINCNFSTNIILAPYLASFNYYLTGNINLSI